MGVILTDTWTVIGVYDSTGQVFVEYVDAETPEAALEEIRELTGASDDLLIVGVMSGRVEVLTPGGDNGSAAYAVDLPVSDEDEEVGA